MEESTAVDIFASSFGILVGKSKFGKSNFTVDSRDRLEQKLEPQIPYTTYVMLQVKVPKYSRTLHYLS